MSWGERSCKEYGDCGISSMSKCNKNCISYRPSLWCPVCRKRYEVANLKCPQKCTVCGTEIQAEWQ
jgi:hypothetical protein